MLTLTKDGGFQFAHFAVAWKIKSMNLREIEGLSIGGKRELGAGLGGQRDYIVICQ